MRRALASLTALLLLLTTQLAWACPVCAQRTDGGWLRNIALGVFIVTPWIVALCVGLWIRRNTKVLRRSSEMTK